MTVYYAPDPINSTQFVPGSNKPATGGKLFFYQGGTNVRQTVYRDEAGSIPWTNPIVLDSGGDLPDGGAVWFQGGQSYKVVFAPYTDTDPPIDSYWTKDNLVGLNDVSSQLGVEWIPAPVVASPAILGSSFTFTMTGDQTQAGEAEIGRRMRLEDASTLYASIVSRSFAAGSTTIQVLVDSGSVSGSLTTASYGFLTASSGSVPMQPGARPLFMDPTDPTKLAQFDLSSVPTSTIVTIPINSTGIVAISTTYALLTSLPISFGTSAILLRSSDIPWNQYDELEFHLSQIQADSITAALRCQLSSDNASSFIAEYRLALSSIISGPSIENFAGTQSTLILSASSVTQEAASHLQGVLRLFAPNVTSNLKSVDLEKILYKTGSSVPTIVSMQGSASYTTDAAINALRFIYTGGINFSSGTITVYGRQ